MLLTKHFSKAQATELSEKLDEAPTWRARLAMLIKDAMDVCKSDAKVLEGQSAENNILKENIRKETIDKGDMKQKERFEEARRQIEGTKEAIRQNRMMSFKLHDTLGGIASLVHVLEMQRGAYEAQLSLDSLSSTIDSYGESYSISEFFSDCLIEVTGAETKEEKIKKNKIKDFSKAQDQEYKKKFEALADLLGVEAPEQKNTTAKNKKLPKPMKNK